MSEIPLAGGASLPPTSAQAGSAAGIDPATPRFLLPLARVLALVNRAMVGFAVQVRDRRR